MSDIIFTTTAGVSLEVLAEALGRCYGNYEEHYAGLAAAQGVPWEPGPGGTPDAAELADMCRVHAVDLAHSVVAREGKDGPIIGVALLGRRGDRGWLGDFAVAPERRGRGLGHRLMAAFLEQVRALGIRGIEFDVLAVNTPALRVYEAAGCRRDQRMDRFVARSADLHLDALSPGMVVAPLARERVAPWFIETMTGQPPPCWERDLPSLLNHTDATYLVAAERGKETAALAYLRERAHGARPALQIAFAGLRAGAGVEHLRALLAEAGPEAGPDIEVTAGLEPVDGRLAGLLRELGFRQTRPAYNMRREL